MEITDKQIEEYQKLYKKEHREDISKKDAMEGLSNLVNFVELLYKIDRKDKERQYRLKKEPKGFHIKGVGYSCCICGFNISNEETWYDKNGIKCLTCQKALDKKLIPSLVCRNKDSWYSIHELDYYYNIKSATVRRLIRQGKLKARIVPSENKKPYFYILLIKDNLGILPNKPKGYSVEDKNGFRHIEYEKVDISKLLKLIK